MLLIVRLLSALSVPDDGLVAAKGTPARQPTQRDHGHPGTVLSSSSGSAIKRIMAGVKAYP
jgi:hypothetical protein